MAAAHYLYGRWEAKAKVPHLEQTYPQLLTGLHPILAERDLNSLETIDRNAKPLLGLVNGLLDVSRIEVEKMDLTLRQFEAGAAVREAVSQLDSLLAAQCLTLEEILPERPIPMQGTRTKVKQIVTKLLSNALKHPEAGRITLTVKQVGDAELGAVLEVAAADTWVAIYSEDQSQLFERFIRLQNPLVTPMNGTDFGLPISAEYARLHGDSITVKSEVGPPKAEQSPGGADIDSPEHE